MEEHEEKGWQQMKSDEKRVRILNVPIDMVDTEAAFSRFRDIIDRPGCEMIVTPNSEIVVNAGKDEELLSLIEKASLIIPDGIGLVYASKIKGYGLNERVTGIDFLSKILEYCAVNSKKVYLLGSKPASDGVLSVAAAAAEAMTAKYPGIQIAGTHHGYFSEANERTLVDEINASGAEFLCVALGSPKQEKFIYKYRDDFLNVRAAIGVGGSLDVWAGNVKRAPEFYQKHGLEWLYRLIQEPSRWKRALALPVFMLKVIFSR